MLYTIRREYTDSDVEDFASLRGKNSHLDKGLFIAEAPKIVEKILRSPAAVPRAFMTEAYLERFRSLLEARFGTTEVIVAAKSAMERVVGYNLHQGVMLAAEIPENTSIEALLRSSPKPYTVVALDSIADAENMGAIIRNCAAFGVSALLLDDQSCNPYLRRSVRVSMGTIIDIPIIRVPDLLEAFSALRSGGEVSIIGAALSEESQPLSEVRRVKNTVLVFGSEGWGLRKTIANACDTLAEIKMASGIDSLNVAIANGIFLYEFLTRV